MKRNHFLQLISVLLIMLTGSLGYAAPVDEVKAQNWADDKGQELLKVFREPNIEKRFRTLDSLFLEYIDLDYISKFVMGRFGREMNEETQANFRNIFKRYALAMYKTLPLEFAKDLQYEVLGAEKSGNFTFVSARVSFRVSSEKTATSAVVKFQLHQTPEGIKLTDIKLNESSLILAYRSRFAEMIMSNDGEIEWFLDDLEDLTKSAEAVNNSKLKQY